MRGWIGSRPEYLRCVREVERLEKRVKGGTATPEERERWRNGVECLAVWDWMEEGSKSYPRTLKGGPSAESQCPIPSDQLEPAPWEK
jgi:hypothetical protein